MLNGRLNFMVAVLIGAFLVLQLHTVGSLAGSLMGFAIGAGLNGARLALIKRNNK